MRLFASGVRKLLRRPASLITLLLMAGLMVLIFVLVGATANSAAPGSAANGTGRAAALSLLTFPGAYDEILSFLLGLGGLFAVIYGAAVAGSEWGWGTLKSAVARGESRIGYTLITFASVAFMIVVGLLIAFAIGVVAALIGASLAHVSTSGVGDAGTIGRLPNLFFRGGLAIVEEGALGFTIATLARSQLAGIGAGIALYFGETFAAFFLGDIIKYLPFSAARAVVAASDTGSSGGFGGGGGRIASLSPDAALVAIVLWLVGSLVVAAAFTRRAEIRG